MRMKTPFSKMTHQQKAWYTKMYKPPKMTIRYEHYKYVLLFDGVYYTNCEYIESVEKVVDDFVEARVFGGCDYEIN
jgi:hypothetical protein